MTTLNLQPFCSTWNPNYKIPWSRGFYTFATDGSIIVRMPIVADIPDNPDSPDALRLWASVSISGDPVSIPELPPVKMTRCEDCLGESKAAIQECEECSGTGMVRGIQSTIIAGMTFADKYLELIKALPGYKFYPVKYDFNLGKSPPPSPFTFDGGEGLLMPVKT